MPRPTWFVHTLLHVHVYIHPVCVHTLLHVHVYIHPVCVHNKATSPPFLIFLIPRYNHDRFVRHDLAFKNTC